MITNSNLSKAAEWARRIDDWRQSGLTLARFCERDAINLASMNRWLYKRECKRAIDEVRRARGVLAEKSASRSASSITLNPPAFVPVRLREIVSSAAKSTPHPAIEILVADDRRILVSRGFDAETLRQVIAVLEAGS